MTDPYGMIDLAALKQPAGAPAGGGSATGGTPSAHEVAVTEQGLEQLIADSQQVATLLLVTSARVPEGEAFEVNNMGVHAVENNGDSDRIHLIFEYYDLDQPVKTAG